LYMYVSKIALLGVLRRLVYIYVIV
jgi:hypothetical protein